MGLSREKRKLGMIHTHPLGPCLRIRIDEKGCRANGYTVVAYVPRSNLTFAITFPHTNTLSTYYEHGRMPLFELAIAIDELINCVRVRSCPAITYRSTV